MGKASRAKVARIASLQAQLATIYATLPELACTGACHDSCGPINWGEHEARLVTRVTGRPPTFTEHLRCTYLSPEHRCEVYTLRPLICRLFGMVKKMTCPFGCVPSRWVTDAEATGLFTKVRILVGEYRDLQPDAAAPQWIRDAFARIADGERQRLNAKTIRATM